MPIASLEPALEYPQRPSARGAAVTTAEYRYIYAADDPINNVDPSGMSVLSWLNRGTCSFHTLAQWGVGGCVSKRVRKREQAANHWLNHCGVVAGCGHETPWRGAKHGFAFVDCLVAGEVGHDPLIGGKWLNQVAVCLNDQLGRPLG